MAMDLRGKIVFITGASSGIGAACARVFAQQGAKLILCARRMDRLEKLANELTAQYQTVSQLCALDVTQSAEVERVVSSLAKEWQEIDILINNAGLAVGRDPLQTTSIAAIDSMIDTNLKGLLYVTCAILPGMVARNCGHIINLGSIAGHYTYAGGGVYAATKHGVKAITEILRRDLLGKKIRVSSIDPGMVETEFSVVRFKGDVEAAKEVYEGMTPLTPEDIADAIYYCASRPPHVNVSDLIIYPTDQASVTEISRGH